MLFDAEFKKIPFFLGLSVAFVFSLTFVLIVWSQTAPDVSYPIPELGNCSNREECKLFCDLSENVSACLNFAELHGLLPRAEIERSRRLLSVENGPGGCANHAECISYCEGVNNLNECLDFAEREGVLSGVELEEARKVARAMKSGYEPPGGCATKSSCEAYCEDPARMPECLAFAESAGLMSPSELEEARKVARAIEAGYALPGNCRGKRQCDAYCSKAENMAECLEFGIAAGFIGPKEAEEARRILPLLEKGETPGRCKSKRQCEAYCSNPENGVECLEFAVKAGIIAPEESEMVRKVMPFLRAGQTPGKCRGKEECEAYCKNPANKTECFEFAKKAGLLSAEELREMEESKEQMRKVLQSSPPRVRECLVKDFGADVVSQIEAGTISADFDSGETIRICFDRFAPAPVIPQDIRPCLEERLGADAVFEMEAGAPTGREVEAVFRICHEQLQKNIDTQGQFTGLSFPEADDR